MRIQTLRIKNLNSLKGEFTIDFHPDSVLGRSGLFAITGTIGAGKTTILDAICVALFGQTPRLGREVTELMSRHTGDCYAEVDFSLGAQLYRCRWGLRRAHQKPEGKIQPPVMELSELQGTEGTILEEKKTEVIKRVEQLTGLDFDRFTRSIMLAQGNFAAFLNAKDNERADLLEKITGTGIYSEISKEVFKRTREEQQKLKELELQADSIQLMSDEERQICQQEKEKLTQRSKSQQEQQQKLQTQLNWLLQLKELQETVTCFQEKAAQAAQAKAEHQPDLKRWEKARLALPLRGAYESLTGKKQEVQTLSQQQQSYQNDIPQLQHQQAEQEQQIQQRQNQFEQFRREQEETEQKILQTLQKDQLLASLAEQLSDQRKNEQRLTTQLTQNRQQEKERKEYLNKIEQSITQFRLYLDKNAHNQALSSELPFIENLLATIRNEQTKLDELEFSQQQIQKESKELEQQSRDLEKKGQQQEKELQQIHCRQQDVQQKKEAITQTPVPDLENRRYQLQQTENQLLRLLELNQGIWDTEAEQTTIAQKLEQVHSRITQLKPELDAVQKEQEEQQRIQQQLTDKLALEQAIQNYEKDRQQLRPDTPCPLCGSTHHPWAGGYQVTPNETRSLLEQQQEKIRHLQQQALEQQHQLTLLEADFQQLQSRQKQVAENYSKQQQKWLEIRQQNKITITFEEREKLSSLQQKTEQEIKTLSEQINRLYHLQKEQEELSRKEQEITKNRTETKLQQEQSSSRLSQQKERALSLKNDHQARQQQLTEQNRQLHNYLKDYEDCPQLLSQRKYSKILPLLKKRSADYLDSQQKLERLETDATRQKDEIKALTTHNNHLTEQQGQLREYIQKLLTQQKTEQQERQNLLGQQNPLTLRSQLNQQKQTLEQQLQQEEKKLQAIRDELNKTQTLLENTTATLKQQQDALQKLTEIFQTKLNQIPSLTDESSFRQALISDAEFKKLEELKEQLSNQETSAQSNLKEYQNRLKAKKAENAVTLPREELEEKSNTLKTEQEQTQQSLGRISEKLTQHDKQLQSQKEKLKQIQQQRIEFNRWNQLNSLIGSADGMKFRRFAQGLTLDYLISLANQNLTKLNNRYILHRNGTEELGLEVIDTYQANATRPTNTLSGGESFLTSLALALGLSNLASRNTQIDSLFLDEGFGTLDTETLEMALDALNSLNASGKTIGIISHVEALKERVPVQLHVSKQAGGCSTIRLIE